MNSNSDNPDDDEVPDQDEMTRLWQERYGNMVPERIVDTRIGEDGRRYYKVQWAASTMEPSKNFLEAELLIQKYWDPVEKKLKLPSRKRNGGNSSQDPDDIGESSSSSKSKTPEQNTSDETTHHTNDSNVIEETDEKEKVSAENEEKSASPSSPTNVSDTLTASVAPVENINNVENDNSDKISCTGNQNQNLTKEEDTETTTTTNAASVTPVQNVEIKKSADEIPRTEDHNLKVEQKEDSNLHKKRKLSNENTTNDETDLNLKKAKVD